MRLSEGRLLKEVVREAMKFRGRVQWVKDLRIGLEAFGWQELDIQALSGLSLSEVKHILKCTAWRRAREGWREEARVRPKLEVMGRLMDRRCETRCVEVVCKRQRRMLMKLRGGTTELQIETGRWCGLRRMNESVRCVTREKWKMWNIFFCTVMVWQRRERRW